MRWLKNIPVELYILFPGKICIWLFIHQTHFRLSWIEKINPDKINNSYFNFYQTHFKLFLANKYHWDISQNTYSNDAYKTIFLSG